MKRATVSFYKRLQLFDQVTRANCLAVFLVYQFKTQTRIKRFDDFLDSELAVAPAREPEPDDKALYWLAASRLLEHVVGVMDPSANRLYLPATHGDFDYKYAYEVLAEKLERIKDYHEHNGFEADYWRVFEDLKAPRS